VRRWSDSGLLASHRVGRRGERRFLRSAVIGLKRPGPSQQAAATDAVLEGVSVPLHSHFCSLYTSPRGRMRLAIPFLRDGIFASAQTCFLMAQDPVARLYEKELESDGIGVTAARENGHLQRIGPFADPDAGIDAFDRAFAAATRRGVVLIRLIGESLSNRERMGSLAHLLRFEGMLFELIHRYPVITLCQYDVHAMAGADVVAVMKAHADNFRHPLGMFLN
jgi:transcriptional repressor of dcmA and dcmR